MDNTYNIPSVTARKAIEQLTDLYEAAYKSGGIGILPSVALWGPMGVGKSTAVKNIADRLSKRLHEKVTVIDIRLLNFSPIDLRGIPSADAGKEFTLWLKPKIFDLPETGVSILFLDEISAAPQSMQAAAYQIALDKQIGEHKLPKDCIVICAGNHTTDKSVAFRMPKALANRLLHFEIRADFQSWYEWAVENNLDERVMGYLAFNNSRLSMEAGMEELAFPTPRSWEFVSRLLKTVGKAPEEMHELIAGCVGISNAGEFEAWCRIYSKLPSTEDILSGKCSSPVKGTDVMYALITSLLSYVTQRQETISEQELDNVCKYVARFPADFSSLFFRGLLKVEGMNLLLMRVPAFMRWIKKNNQYI